MTEPELEKCIGLVREGTFDLFAGGESIGEVFGMFFRNPHWDGEQVNGSCYVTFTGQALFDNRESGYVFLFSAQPEKELFNLEFVAIDGIYLTDPDINGLLGDIYYAFEEELPPEKVTPDMTDLELQAVLEDCDDLVRTGAFDGYEELTVEQVLDDFFEDGCFRPVVGVDDSLYVNYTGIANYRGKRSEFAFQFSVDEGRESFLISSLEIDGVPLPDPELDAVLADILNSYKNRF